LSGDLLHVVGATLDRAALALILALALAALWLAPATVSSDSRRRSQLLLSLLVISVFAAAVDLLLRSAALADVPPGQAWHFIPRVLNHSDYGFFWQLRAAAWLVMLVMLPWCWLRGWSVVPSLLLAGAVLAIVLLMSATSHAGEEGVGSLPNLINWLHLVGLLLWGGPVMLYALVILPQLQREGWPPQTAAGAPRLSTVATIALAMVLLTGLFNSWRQLGTLAALWGTTYGLILLFKLALVTLMMVIGAFNRFRLVPQVEVNVSGARQRFLRVLRFDSLLFMLILVTAVVLGMQMPPAHAEDEEAMIHNAVTHV
jgi:putative copper resistance protein D